MTVCREVFFVTLRYIIWLDPFIELYCTKWMVAPRTLPSTQMLPSFLYLTKELIIFTILSLRACPMYAILRSMRPGPWQWSWYKIIFFKLTWWSLLWLSEKSLVLWLAFVGSLQEYFLQIFLTGFFLRYNFLWSPQLNCLKFNREINHLFFSLSYVLYISRRIQYVTLDVWFQLTSIRHLINWDLHFLCRHCWSSSNLQPNQINMILYLKFTDSFSCDVNRYLFC